MHLKRISIILSFLSLAACAVNKGATAPPADYVEIPNPAFTMSSDAPETIWVPRSYVESGVPRGSELVKKGYEKVTAAPQAAPQSVASTRQLSPGAVVVKNRIAMLEIGENGLTQPLNEKMKSGGCGILLDPAQAAFVSKYANLAGQAERGSFAKRLQQDYGTNLVVIVSATEGVAPGKPLIAEIYEGIGGSLVSSVSAPLSQYAAADNAARDAAVASAMTDVAAKVKETAALTPWYGKIVEVEGERIYINAGREAGIGIGQKLKIYRGGKVVAGLGFAPGEKVGVLEISGYAGPNGAYGVVKDGVTVRTTDLVAVE